MQIPIFKAEADIAKLIRANSRISYASALSTAEPHRDLPPRTVAAIERHRTQGTNQNQIDLHYLKTVLASTVWNRNDDVFDPLETWIARATPEDKPFNLEHDPAEIIGHITSTYVIDKDGETIADDSSADDLPSLFHVVTGAVLYKYWAKEDLQERMDTILAEIAEGKWYVSMECLFTNFDYAMKDTDGTCRVIARNSETAFLTKHLRTYGGSGIYRGQPIGRVLRNIVFSGKGLVAKPANPDSLVFQDGEEISFASFSQDLNAGGYISLTPDLQNPSNKESTDHLMTQATANTDSGLEKEVERLRAENKELRDNDIQQLTEAKAEVDAKLDEAKAKLAEVKAEAEARLQEVEAQLAEANTKVGELTEQLETEKASAQELSDKLAKVEADKEDERRRHIVAEKLEITGEEADTMLQTMANLPAEAFDAQVDFLAKAMAKSTPAPVAPKSTPAPNPPKSTPKEAPLDASASLETATPEADPSLNVTDGDDTIQSTRQAIAAFFGCDSEDE